MAEGMQVEGFREAVLVTELPEAFGKGVGVNELSGLVGEQVIAHGKAALLCFHPLPVIERLDQTGHLFPKEDASGLAVFGGALLYALSGHSAAGAADHHQAGFRFHVILPRIHEEVRPLQGA